MARVDSALIVQQGHTVCRDVNIHSPVQPSNDVIPLFHAFRTDKKLEDEVGGIHEDLDDDQQEEQTRRTYR